MKKINWKNEVIRVFSISFSLFLLLYGLFALTANFIHSIHPAINLNTVLWWQQISLTQPDGIELYVMTFFGFIYIIASLVLFKIVPLKSKLLTPFFFLSSAVLLYVFSQIRTEYLGFSNNIVFLLVWMLIISFACWLFYSLTEKRLSTKTIVFILLGIFAFVTLVSLDTPSFYDYGFYLGPGLKLMQGENFHTFFSQYDLFGILLFWLMMQAKLQIYQMQIILWAIMVGWFYLYYLLAKKLIKSPFLILLFMLVLIIVRFFSVNYGDPVQIPATLPFRIDLWVPLLLLLLSLGFSSIYTSFAFSLAFLLNDTFGLFYLALYLLFILIMVLLKRVQIKKFMKLCIFPVLFFFVHYLIFGSFLSIGGSFYQNIGLGFLPISLNSPFWIIMLLLPIEIYLLTKERKNISELIVNLFILGLFNLQFVYYYGRSHDNNLLNISGIWLFILFLSLSKISKKFQKATLILAVTVVLVLAFFSSRETQRKLDIGWDRLSRGKLVEISPLEQNINKNLNFFNKATRSKILLMDGADSFFNYKFGLQQKGFYVPFSIRVFTDDTSKFLVDQLKAGVAIVAWNPELIQPPMMKETIPQLNDSAYMKNNHLKFYLKSLPSLYQLFLENVQSEQQDGSQSGSMIAFKFKDVSFSYPKPFTVIKKDGDTLLFEDNLKIPALKMTVILPKPVDLSSYINSQKGQGELKGQGIIKIFGYSVFTQEWQANEASETHFFLVKDNSLIQLILNTADQQATNLFNNILKTMQ